MREKKTRPPAARENNLRLFVACELPPEALEALARVQSDLRDQGAGRLRWVRPEGVHLTLKFLGGVASAKAERVIDALAKAIVEPFTLNLRFDRLGSFGGRMRLRVLWVGLAGDVEELASLAETVEKALKPLGFPRETRPFAPHLTLARVPDDMGIEERSRLADLVAAYKLPSQPSMTISEVALMQSFLQPGGARYEQRAAFPSSP
ncbi:MAG TPA: RNA 2',3'-cyclic phosphodiesterase [Dehalococcoidia bacterium]|nr:RNA 2',3'-cyclic phosphodiesterase [Dehalococcoidia bacterium]